MAHATDEKEPINPKTLLVLGLILVALVGGGFYASEILWTPKPPGPEPIPHAGSEELQIESPPSTPPAQGTLDERVRGYFQNIGTKDCLQKHLPKDARVDGVAEFVMNPDGSVKDVQVKTEPSNVGVALCVEQRLAKGFAFEGAA